MIDKKYPVKISKTEDSADLLIVWSIHNFCNFNCSYCPEENSNGSEKWNNLEHSMKVVDKLHDHYVAKLGFQKVLISFTGGEPIFFKGFPELVNYIKKKKMFVGLTTNGSGSLNMWKKFYHELEFISISYHPEFAKNDDIFALYQAAHDDPNVVLPTLRTMIPSKEDEFNKAMDVVNKIKSFPNHSYEFVRIQNDFGKNIEESHYNDNQEKFLEKNTQYVEIITDESIRKISRIFMEHKVEYTDGSSERLRSNELVNQNQINFEGWKCSAGLESLFIDYFGNVFLSGCKIGGERGNIKNLEELTFPSEPAVCTFSRCICQSDIEISKTRPL